MHHWLIKILLILLYTHQALSDDADDDSKENPPHTKSNSATNLNECRQIDPTYVKCDFNSTCIYGEPNTVQCRIAPNVPCSGTRVFDVTFVCLYCWQLPEEAYTCVQNTTCRANSRYQTTCTANSTTYCLGHREFKRYKPCVLLTGHKWSMALVLSILFGGFGVDRFYLGHWQEGVGKLFSFGGFGVWTLIDTILIYIGYLKPADSTRYE